MTLTEEERAIAERYTRARSAMQYSDMWNANVPIEQKIKQDVRRAEMRAELEAAHMAYEAMIARKAYAAPPPPQS